MTRTRIKHKLLQQLYTPKKSRFLSEGSKKLINDMEKAVEESVTLLTGKKKKKQKDEEKKEEK